MTKAQRLLKQWNYLNHRPNYKNEEQDELDRQEWKKINKELGDYLIRLAFQGKLFSVNTNGNLCCVHVECRNIKRNSVRIDDFVFDEAES